MAIVAAVPSSCGKRQNPEPSVRAHLLRKSELTSAEIKYGRGVKPDPNVEYQRDVVIVENGPEIIRSAAADGFTWVIDAQAGRGLYIGKIAFITGQCVGRVLKLSRDGNNLTIILGPVQLTDVFKKLHISLDQPLDMAEAIPLPTPQIPNLKLPVEGLDAAPPEWALPPGTPRAAVRQLPLRYDALLQPAAYQAVAPGIPQRLDLSFKTKPMNVTDGAGMQLAHESAGVRLVAQAQLRYKVPRLEFDLNISPGKIAEARIILHNAAGIHLAFDSAVSDAFSGNVQWYLPGGGFWFALSTNVPLAANIRQDIWVQTAYSARQSVYNTAADYDLNADVGFTFQNGTFRVIGPKGVTVRNSVLSNMSGVSVGANGLLLRYVLTLTGGLGIWEFSTGPSFSFGSSLGASMGASEGIVQCRDATLGVFLRAGVGWTIPPVIAKFVNFFLRLINVREIPDHDGLYTPWTRLFWHYEKTDSPVCRS